MVDKHYVHQGITDLSRMRTILRMTIRGGVQVAAICLVALPAAATLRGDTYTNSAHEITLVRPDATWELREGISIPAAVAAFVVGEGTAAAVVLHWRLAADVNITDTEDFLARRPELAQLIAATSVGDAGEVIVTGADFKPQADRIGFVIEFENREFDRGPLENLVSGLIIRGADDRQYIVAVRCATTRGRLEAWRGQFDRFTSSLTYTGAMAAPVYASRPVSRFWWFAAAGVIVAVLVLAGRRRRPEPEIRRIRAAHSHADAPAPLPELIAPVSLDSAPDEALNVPDMFRASGSHLDAVNAHPDIAGEGTVPTVASPEIAETTLTHAGAGYWTCGCGRKNANTDSFCCRCNADRASSREADSCP